MLQVSMHSLHTRTHVYTRFPHILFSIFLRSLIKVIFSFYKLFRLPYEKKFK